jgi:hypothetical protein
MEGFRRVLGKDHPSTMMALNDYRFVLESLGRFTQAEPLARQAVAWATANPSLGPQHPQTKGFAAAHARCLDALGRRDEAAAVRKEFGLPDPATRASTQPATGPQ